MSEARRRDRLRNILNVSQIASVSVIILGIFAYVWLNTDIKNADPILQIVAIGVVSYVLAFVVNFILNRRW